MKPVISDLGSGGLPLVRPLELGGVFEGDFDRITLWGLNRLRWCES